MAKRITLKYLSNWLDEKFKEYGINFHVTKAYRTNFRSQDYEGGAYRLIFKIQHNENKNNHTTQVICNYRCSEIEEYLNSGYKLKFVLRDQMIVDSEIDVVKL